MVDHNDRFHHVGSWANEAPIVEEKQERNPAFLFLGVLLLVFFSLFLYFTFIDTYLHIRADVRREMMKEGWDSEKELRATCEELKRMPENRRFMLRLQTPELHNRMKEKGICDEPQNQDT